MSKANLSCGVELFFDSEIAASISPVGENGENVRIEMNSTTVDQELSLVLRRADFEELVTSGQRFLLVESPEESDD